MKKVIYIVCMCLCMCLLCSCSSSKNITIYENCHGYTLGTEMESISLEQFIALAKENEDAFAEKYAKDGIQVVFVDKVKYLVDDLLIDLESGITIELHNPDDYFSEGKSYEFKGIVEMNSREDYGFVIKPHLYSSVD